MRILFAGNFVGSRGQLRLENRDESVVFVQLGLQVAAKRLFDQPSRRDPFPALDIALHPSV